MPRSNIVWNGGGGSLSGPPDEDGSWSPDQSGDRFVPDAIMVLAGGQLPDGGVPEWVQRRLDASLHLYRAHGASCPIVCLGGGTPHRPPVFNSAGHVIHEGTSCAAYLVRKGVDPDHILKEWGSYDTIANGFFALTWHALPRAWTRLVVVTSEFHMARTRLVFEWVFALRGAGPFTSAAAAATKIQAPPGGERVGAGLSGETKALESSNGGALAAHHPEPAAARGLGAAASWSGPPGSGPDAAQYLLRFLSVSDEGIDPAVIQARTEKELKSIQSLRVLMARIETLPQFHAWLHTEHKAYNVRNQDDFGKVQYLPEEDPSRLAY